MGKIEICVPQQMEEEGRRDKREKRKKKRKQENRERRKTVT